MRKWGWMVVLLAVAIAGCGGDDDGETSTATTTVTETTEAETQDEETTDETETDGGSETTDVGPLDSFTTPSKNISCAVTEEFVRCDIFEHSYEPPPKPASCEFDYGSSLSVGVEGPAEFACVSDAVTGSPDTLTVLEYGTQTTVGPFRCESSEAGVRCENTDTGSGFTLAREIAEAF
ncbi:MAG: hypothetical protein QOI31_1658 [Solirubrobacterales bacterium]|jgi:hypothetical protein|nr:hypothetical protein [Solirubrobacterales bacterium]